MNRLLIALLLCCATFIPTRLPGQEDDSLLTSLTTPETDYVSATFKATRIINGHSVEQMMAGQLDARFHHRFGPVNSGAAEFWGLDQANIFIGLEYGVTDWLMLGLGRTSYQKTYDGFAKFRLIRQSAGETNIPVSVSALAGVDVFTAPWSDPARRNYFSSRVAYTFQAFIARKFTDELSLQVTPTVIHRNMVPEANDNNDLYAVGLGGRYKISSRVSVNAEYFIKIEPSVVGKARNPDALSFGFDIETGGHVFQIMLTNSVHMIERGFIGETTGTWTDGGIHLGFNISRVFTL
jgi:hypothetical protein